MSKVSILIVEDEYIAALDIQQNLENAGYIVAGHADRGDTAFQLAKTMRPNLVLMDIGLKGEMDGIETAGYIREICDIPVIFLTAFSNQETLERARLVEPYGYILKPFNTRELIGNIEMALYKHRMEKELRESENKFRSVIENSSDGIMLVDEQGKVIEWNPAAEQISGLKRSELLGMSMNEVILRMVPETERTADRRERDKKQWKSLIDNEYAGELDYMKDVEIVTPSGEHKIVQTNGFAIKTVNGTLAGAIMRDVTERRKVEDALRDALKREQFLGDIIRQTTVMIGVFGLGGKRIMVNNAAVNQTGYSEEELLNPDSGFNLSVPKLRDFEAEKLGQIHQTKKASRFEIEFIRKDGSRFPAEVIVHPHLDEAGNIDAYFLFATDITERKKVEIEFRKLSQAVEQSANVVVITDVEANIEYANPKFTELTGYSLSEVLKQNPRILHSGEHPTEYYEQLWQTIKSGKVWHGEFHNKRKDGSLYWEDTTIAPVFNPSGEIVNFIANKEDITERKALEAAEREQRQLAEALLDTVTALNSTLKLDEVLDRILGNLGNLVTYDAAMVLLVEGYTVRKIRSQSRAAQDALRQPTIGNTQANLINVPILQEMQQTGQPCLIPNTRADPRWRDIPGMTWIRSFVSAPINIRGHIAGLINIISAEADFFTPLNAQRLMAFANQAAIALENARLFEQAHLLSITDPLTELFNRRHFFEVANTEFERHHRYGGPLSVIMMDIDHFKNVNDRYGHAVGDMVMQDIARQIKASIRAVDIAARYGGEEFVVLMPETGLDEACRVAERLRHNVNALSFEQEDSSFLVTLSLGVAEVSPTMKSLDDLLMYSDQALYTAKAAGRNRVDFYKNDGQT